MYYLATKVGSVFQNPRTQFFNVDVDSEIAFGIENIAVPPDELHQRLEYTLDSLKIRKLQGKNIFELSGGEKQRIAIARAILKNAPIVVLDEAMAFTDAENELALREGMAELLKGKTVLMIAHRLYSIQDADMIFVLENGRLKESGTHKDLLQKHGLYAHLWDIQNETESWRMKGGVAHVSDNPAIHLP